MLGQAERYRFAAWLPQDEEVLTRFEAEHPNARAAVTWLGDAAEPEWLLRLAAALCWFWSVHGHLREGQAWVERALAAAPAAPPVQRARAVIGLGLLVFLQGDDRRADTLYREGLDLFRAAADALGIAHTLAALGALAIYQGNLDDAVASLHEALIVAQTVTEPQLVISLTGAIHSSLGMAAHGQRDLPLATTRFERAIEGFRALGHQWG